jgi:RNA polymerase sigma-70 factor (ECF subfamily)
MQWEPSGQAATLTDRELVERVKHGWTEAFGLLVRRYQDRVFNACWRICGNLEDARDLTQDAFLRVFENLSSFRHESGFFTWLFRVAVNLSISHRRKTRLRPVAASAVGFGFEGTQADELAQRAGRWAGPAAEDTVGQAELAARALRALQALDEDHRAVVVLRDLEGLDYAQIGQILEIPVGTVRSRLHRARMELRRMVLPTVKPGD